jgi:hypothetical protein
MHPTGTQLLTISAVFGLTARTRGGDGEAAVKYFNLFIFFLWTGFAFFSSASVFGGARIGGVCDYRRIYGWAAITEIRSAASDAENCNDAVDVIFTFTPDEPRTPQDRRFADFPNTGQYLRVGAGLNPARAWARSKGLVEGSVHRCIRSEIIKGACTPVVFTFPELDMEGWERACFGNR